ncbi:small integral membrane protein 8 isoform X3 [Marmota marmota marmota]|uniref:small integral membrane protein 8 isoform X3 n=1 Tax=Marmota marmota marmota TaxID=9994 RepID=UPI00209297FF|nr:small integral membrane protein 8 isoform X3 [Marmota marmota marmota]
MSSAPEPPTLKKESPKEKDFPNPGLRGVRTTTLFRAVNPELFVKPVLRGRQKIRGGINITREAGGKRQYDPKPWTQGMWMAFRS